MRIAILLTSLLVSHFLALEARANVVLGGTRLIYPERELEVTIPLANKGIAPALVQSWMDDGAADSTPENSHAPFLVMPPIVRVEPQQSQTLRILFNGASLPRDHESLFWLNVLEIPPVSPESKGKSNLLLAIQSRIKVFYRPSGIPGSLHDAAQGLTWRVQTEAGMQYLVCNNASPFHISFGDIHLFRAGKTFVNDDGTRMVAPGAREKFALKMKGSAPAGKKEGDIEFTYINDYGALKTISKAVEP